MDILGIFLIILYIAGGIFFLYCWARIWRKAGFSPWLCLLMLLPVVNLISFIYLAFAAWPNESYTGGKGKLQGGMIR